MRQKGVLDRGIGLLSAIVEDAGATPLSVLAERAGLPISTAYRFVSSLERQGLVVRVSRGRYLPGLAIHSLSGAFDPRTVIARASRPFIRKLARSVHMTVHLGVLDSDMVTYIVKECGGRESLFTREGMQLEAYCTAVGKVLLAALSKAEREAYLRSGPFISLTPNTITDPDLLRAELESVGEKGYAIDDSEISGNLNCAAVPIRSGRGRVVAALSLSLPQQLRDEMLFKPYVELLRECADAIETHLYRSWN